MEDTAITTISLSCIIFLYCLWRTIVTFIPSNKKSIKEYPSRFVFRILIFIHFILALLAHYKFALDLFEGWLSTYFLFASYIIADVATLCLSKSIQDFALFINRESSCFTTYFWNLSIPSLLLLCCFEIGILYSKIVEATAPIFVFSITYWVIFAVIIFSLIYLPLFTFLREIDKFDINGEWHKRLIVGYIFIIIALLFIIAAIFVYNWLLRNYESSRHMLPYSREFVYLFLSMTQDMLDWLIKSLITEVDSETIPTDSLRSLLV